MPQEKIVLSVKLARSPPQYTSIPFTQLGPHRKYLNDSRITTRKAGFCDCVLMSYISKDYTGVLNSVAFE